MNKSHEVEYCNLELRFDRQQIRTFIKSLIQEGYSLYWNESDDQFTLSIRTGRKLFKLRFHRMGEKFKIIGDYLVKDERLSELLEDMINKTKGHAVIKRFKDQQILVENIMFGEIIRTVEISGVEKKVVFQKEPMVTIDEILQAFKSKRAEIQIPIVRLEIDYELLSLYDALEEGNLAKIAAAKQRLKMLRSLMLQLEM